MDASDEPDVEFAPEPPAASLTATVTETATTSASATPAQPEPAQPSLPQAPAPPPVKPKKKAAGKTARDKANAREASRWSLLRQLEWMIRYLDEPDNRIPNLKNVRRDIHTRLLFYRKNPDAQKDLFKLYHSELSKQEVREAKAADDRPAARLEDEPAMRLIDEFLRKWDGVDPMAPAVGLPATCTEGQKATA